MNRRQLLKILGAALVTAATGVKTGAVNLAAPLVKIAERARKPQWLLVSPTLIPLFASLEGFERNTHGIFASEICYVGNLQGMKVYTDPYSEKDSILLGYKGVST